MGCAQTLINDEPRDHFSFLLVQFSLPERAANESALARKSGEAVIEKTTARGYVDSGANSGCNYRRRSGVP